MGKMDRTTIVIVGVVVVALVVVAIVMLTRKDDDDDSSSSLKKTPTPASKPAAPKTPTSTTTAPVSGELKVKAAGGLSTVNGTMLETLLGMKKLSKPMLLQKQITTDVSTGTSTETVKYVPNKLRRHKLSNQIAMVTAQIDFYNPYNGTGPVPESHLTEYNRPSWASGRHTVSIPAYINQENDDFIVILGDFVLPRAYGNRAVCAKLFFSAFGSAFTQTIPRQTAPSLANGDATFSLNFSSIVGTIVAEGETMTKDTSVTTVYLNVPRDLIKAAQDAQLLNSAGDNNRLIVKFWVKNNATGSKGSHIDTILFEDALAQEGLPDNKVAIRITEDLSGKSLLMEAHAQSNPQSLFDAPIAMVATGEVQLPAFSAGDISSNFATPIGTWTMTKVDGSASVTMAADGSSVESGQVITIPMSVNGTAMYQPNQAMLVELVLRAEAAAGGSGSGGSGGSSAVVTSAIGFSDIDGASSWPVGFGGSTSYYIGSQTSGPAAAFVYTADPLDAMVFSTTDHTVTFEASVSTGGTTGEIYFTFQTADGTNSIQTNPVVITGSTSQPYTVPIPQGNGTYTTMVMHVQHDKTFDIASMLVTHNEATGAGALRKTRLTRSRVSAVPSTYNFAATHNVATLNGDVVDLAALFGHSYDWNITAFDGFDSSFSYYEPHLLSSNQFVPNTFYYTNNEGTFNAPDNGAWVVLEQGDDSMGDTLTYYLITFGSGAGSSGSSSSNGYRGATGNYWADSTLHDDTDVHQLQAGDLHFYAWVKTDGNSTTTTMYTQPKVNRDVMTTTVDLSFINNIAPKRYVVTQFNLYSIDMNLTTTADLAFPTEATLNGARWTDIFKTAMGGPLTSETIMGVERLSYMRGAVEPLEFDLGAQSPKFPAIPLTQSVLAVTTASIPMLMQSFVAPSIGSVAYGVKYYDMYTDPRALGRVPSIENGSDFDAHEWTTISRDDNGESYFFPHLHPVQATDTVHAANGSETVSYTVSNDDVALLDSISHIFTFTGRYAEGGGAQALRTARSSDLLFSARAAASTKKSKKGAANKASKRRFNLRSQSGTMQGSTRK